MVTRLGWFSDCHLGLAQYGLQARYDDMFKAVESVIDGMAAKGITNAICTGDLLNSTRPSPDTIFRLRELGYRMERNGIACLTMMGNHDLTPSPNWVELANPGMNGWARRKPQPGLVTSDGPPRMLGFDFCSNDRLRTFDYHAPHMADVSVIGIHAAVQEFVRFKSDSMLSIKDLPIDGRFAAVLLGDIHVCDIRQTPDGVLYGYPGSTELCSESEASAKFWIELVLENNRVLEFIKHPIETRKVLRWQIESELELMQAQADLGGFKPEEKGERNPMIFVRYDPKVPDVITRLRQNPGFPHVILRPLVLDSQERPEEADPSLVEHVKVNPVELLRQAVPEGPLQLVAERLLNPEAEARPVLREFVSERLS